MDESKPSVRAWMVWRTSRGCLYGPWVVEAEDERAAAKQVFAGERAAGRPLQQGTALTVFPAGEEMVPGTRVSVYFERGAPRIDDPCGAG